MATHELESQPGRQIEKRVEPNESHVHCYSKKKRTKVAYRSRVLDGKFSLNRFVIPITTFN